MSYVQAEFRRRICRPIFFLSNQCCKADCLENTVDFSGCIRPTVSFLLPSTSCGTSEPGLLKALSRAASAAEASILRLRLHSTMVAGPRPAGPDPALRGRTPPCGAGPAPGAGACCGEGRVRREGLLLRPQRRWHGRLIKLVALDERCALGRRSQAAVR